MPICRRPLVRAVASAAVLGVVTAGLVERTNEDDCRNFHRQCREARAAGDTTPGICNVERLECASSSAGSEEGVGKEPPAAEGRERRATRGRPVD